MKVHINYKFATLPFLTKYDIMRLIPSGFSLRLGLTKAIDKICINNVSSSCADNSSEVKCGDVHGSEPVVISNVSEPYFEHYSEPTESDIAFTSSLFASFSAFVSSCEPAVLGKTDNVCVDDLNNKCGDDCFSANVCDPNVSNVSVHESVTGEVPQDAFSETTETTSQENQEYPDSSSESVSVGVPNVESSGTPLETVDEIKPKSDSHDTCVDETHVDETSTCSKTETETDG